MTLFHWLIVAMAIAPAGVACTIVYSPVTTGPSFRVTLSDQGQPVKGVLIKLSADKKPFRTAVTDKSGIARFRDISPGSYFVTGDNADDAAVEVKTTGPSNVNIPMNWPRKTPLATTALKGRIHIAGWAEEMQPEITLDLTEGSSPRVVKTVRTTGTGAFDIPNLGPGMYFLHVKTSSNPAADVIPIKVETSGRPDSLDIEVGWTSCGMQYIDHNRCSQTSLHLRRVAGYVFDASQASLAYAAVLLVDQSEKVVSRVLADRDGNFALPAASDGEYKLYIGSNGFSGLRANVRIDSSGKNSLLHAQLQIGGCSTAAVR